MPLTKKEKLETFDAVLAERDLLRLAIFGYMVLSGGGAQFWTVRDIQDHAQDSDVYWRAVRYGAWKLANSTKSAWNASENA